MYFLRLCAMIICVAVVTSLFAVSPDLPIVSACPIEPPVPLRKLCQQSDLIVVAKTGKSKISDLTGAAQTDKSKTIERAQSGIIRVEMKVDSKHKGDDSDSTIYVYHTMLIAQSDSPSPSGSVRNSLFPEDETILLFLNRREKGDGYQVADYRRGIKRLSEADREIYTQRIDELIQITKAENPDVEKIIEWLVRCAEEPATRWEGAWDMRYSNIDELRRKNKNEIEIVEQAVSDQASVEEVDASDEVETVNEEDEVESVDEEIDQEGEGIISQDEEATPLVNEVIARLTPEQRERLEAVLFSLDEPDSEDLDLALVIGEWAASRVVEFLLPHLSSAVEEAKKDENKRYLADRLMQTIAQALEDEKLNKLLEKYYGVGLFDFGDSEEEDEDKLEAMREAAERRLAEEQPAIIEAFIAKAKKQIGQ